MDDNLALFSETEFMRPLAAGWTGKIDLARNSNARRWWKENADQCMMFFCASTGFMWDARYKDMFWGEGGPSAPRFRITVNRAFEFVAKYRPMIMNRYPIRTVRPRRMLQIPPDFFGPQDDPQAQQLYQQAAQETQQMSSQDWITSQMLSQWLNYTPREQPWGGLLGHAERAVTAALVKGRGCLWPKEYTMPGSQRKLTGLFEDDPETLLIDPDAKHISQAKWISHEWYLPHWEVERRFGLATDSLKGKGVAETAWSQGETATNWTVKNDQANGRTYDMIRFYEIWSKGGVGARLAGVNTPLKNAFDEVVGDYAYIVVAEGVPYPLNAPPEKVRNWTDEDVKRAFRWPTPYWTDDRWPVAILDFYEKPQCAYPVGPLAPGLGELKAINVMLSHLLNRTWSSSRDFVASPKHMRSEVEKLFKEGKDLAVFGVSDLGADGDASKAIQFIQQPEGRTDYWRLLDMLGEMFDRRVGLTELLYGQNPGGTQPRTAEEVAQKRQSVSVTPDDMAHRVEEWLTDGARLEAICTYFHVKAQDVGGILPPIGQQFWQQLIENAPGEKIVREYCYELVSGTARKPNKDRDVANMGQTAQVYAPLLFQFGGMAGDFTAFNNLMQRHGEAMDEDLSSFALQMPQPDPNQPTPEQMQAEQARMELELMGEKAQLEGQIKSGQAQLAAQLKAEDADLQHQIVANQAAMKNRLAFIDHALTMRRDEEKHDQEMKQGAEQSRAKVAATRAVVRAKPSSNGKSKSGKRAA